MKNQLWAEVIPVIFWNIVIFVPVIFVPILFTLRRTGKSLWWSALCFVPLIGFIVALYVIAFSRWPKENAPRYY
jgi:uncharacterized membrane protein YhaH (DUF805 family)